MEEGVEVSSWRGVAAGKGERVKQVIVERIRSGAYPVGSRLPGVRAAADEFGVHANTVSRVYGDLADMGLVRTVHGSGTFVIALPSEEHAGQAAAELTASLRQLAQQARRLGLSREEWTLLAREAEAAAYDSDGLKTWFVECSFRDSEDLAASLSTLLERPVRPLLTSDLPDRVPELGEGAHMFITTPFHLEEVDEAVGAAHQVVNVNVMPAMETLVQLARVEPDARVTVVASNPATLARFVRMVRTYTRLDPVATVLVDEPTAPELVRTAEVLVDSQSIHERVLGWGPRGQVVTVRFQLEPTSVAYVREVLRRRESPPS